MSTVMQILLKSMPTQGLTTCFPKVSCPKMPEQYKRRWNLGLQQFVLWLSTSSWIHLDNNSKNVNSLSQSSGINQVVTPERRASPCVYLLSLLMIANETCYSCFLEPLLVMSSHRRRVGAQHLPVITLEQCCQFFDISELTAAPTSSTNKQEMICRDLWRQRKWQNFHLVPTSDHVDSSSVNLRFINRSSRVFYFLLRYWNCAVELFLWRQCNRSRYSTDNSRRVGLFPITNSERSI